MSEVKRSGRHPFQSRGFPPINGLLVKLKCMGPTRMVSKYKVLH